jgi:nucleoside-diphosphate-sugar epimerase
LVTVIDRRPLAVITGAAGRVGSTTIAALAGDYRLRLVDIAWPGTGDAPDAERRTSDLRSADACIQALDGADVLVNLAANPRPQQLVSQALIDVALVGGQVAAAVESSSLRRVVYASSIHTMGLYNTGDRVPISTRWSPRPCCSYGAAKVFTEHAFALAARRTSVAIVGLRMGLIGYPPPDRAYASQWLGTRDYTRMLRAALTAPVSHEMVFALSVGADRHWDLDDTNRVLGVEPSEEPVVSSSAPMQSPGGAGAGSGSFQRCLMFGAVNP